jgi:lysophospholipase L1-like esterase
MPLEAGSETMRRFGWAVFAALCLAASSCGGGNGDGSAAAPSPGGSTASKTTWHVLALGDSETTGSGDETGKGGWVQYYADKLESGLGVTVEVNNLAEDGLKSDELLARLTTEPMRTAVRNADIVVLGIGGADLERGDAAVRAGSCQAEACYKPVLSAFARNFESIVAGIRAVRGPDKAVLRTITAPNVMPGAEDVIPSFLKPVADKIGIYQATTANQAMCQSMSKHDGQCVDVLHAFNGPSGTDNAYQAGLMNHDECCYPSAKGHQLIADLLVKTGQAPLR